MVTFLLGNSNKSHKKKKSVWSPVVDQVLECKRDTRAEAQEHDSNAIGVYLINIKPKGDSCWTCSHRIVTLIEKLY